MGPKCPHCDQLGVSAVRRFISGRAALLRCRSCGALLRLGRGDWMLLLLPAVLGGLAVLVKSSLLVGVALGAFAMGSLAHTFFVPLVAVDLEELEHHRVKPRSSAA